MPEVFSEIQDLSLAVDRREAELHVAQQNERRFASTCRHGSRWLAYYRFLRLLRSPSKSFELWQLGITLVTAAGCAAFAALLLLSGGGSASSLAIGSVLAACMGGGVARICFSFPNDVVIESKISTISEALASDRARLVDCRNQTVALRQQLEMLRLKRSQILTSVRYHREELLLKNWKAMRDIEWENYLAEVFRALGGKVEMTNTVGDQGIDIVVDLARRRIAIQAKGYHNPVGNTAVQEAVAGRAHYRCNSCAVITNSRFTKSAQELAASNNCRLIGENEFEDFVRGKIEW